MNLRSRLMEVCGVGASDFKFMDLIFPQGVRFVRQLSAIINFCKFRETDWTDMAMGGADDMERLLESQKKLQQEKEELIASIKEET